MSAGPLNPLVECSGCTVQWDALGCCKDWKQFSWVWKADLQKGVSPCNICDGLHSCISSVLLPHRNLGFRCDAVVINCPSEHSATVEEAIVGREYYLPWGEERRRSPEGARDLCLKRSRDPWEALSQEWVSGQDRNTWDLHTGWDLEPLVLHKAKNNKMRRENFAWGGPCRKAQGWTGQAACFS